MKMITMKTSNIIIIAFVLFIVSGMIILFADSKIRHQQMQSRFTYKEYPLGVFSCVVVKDSADVHIDQSDSSFIKVEYNKEKPTPATIYEIKNDTLFISGGLRTFVKCKTLKDVRANKPYWLGVGVFQLDMLQISIKGGILQFYTHTNKRSRLNNLVINATDSSRIYGRDVDVERLTLHASTNTYCEFRGDGMQLSAELKNKSDVLISNSPESISLKRDKESSFKVY